MKKAHVFSLALATVMSLCGLVGCSKNSGGDEGEFNFSIAIEGDYSTLEIRDTPYQLVVYDNGIKTENREYTFTSNNPAVASIVPTTGFITAKSEGTVRFTVTESQSGIEAYKVIDVIKAAPKARGGYNYSAAATPEQRASRTEILGKLEKYAMDTHLTGISLFENGGYMLYSQRALALLGNREYITGFGYGLLSDSDAPFTSELPGRGRDAEFPYHYHTASSSDPGTINALNAAGSQVSDLSSYITSSYFGMKLNSTRTEAEWYAQLADSNKHPMDSVTNTPKMYHTGPHNDTDMYTGWRIYVRTNDDGVRYSYKAVNDWSSQFDGRQVVLEDYEFILRFLLTGSHNLKRGNEMAADTSYGIKGAQAYNAQTKSGKNDDECKDLWNSMKNAGKLGVRTGTADGSESYPEEDGGGFYPAGDYIEFDLLNPIDSFTAMYTLSSSLYSPIPEDFMKMVGQKKGGGTDKQELLRASSRYGAFNNNTDVPDHLSNNIVASTICCGAYYLEKWEKTIRTVFTVNDTWYETKAPYNRYKIAGVRIKIDPSITEITDAYYNEFVEGNLDACALPQKHMDEKSKAKKVEGDSVFKLNVNSCTQEQWDARFGPKGSIAPGHSWNVKPWMSNENFLNGLFWSIDRKSFADKRGVQPSINYFSGSYMSDPQRNISYNSTKAHEDAVAKYHNVRKDSEGKPIPETDDYGYNKDTAINYFKTAVAQLVKQGKLNYGTVDNPNEITIEIWWMYQSDTTEYGVDIKSYFETAFNDPAVSGGRVKLNVINKAVTVWEYVYDQHLQVGEFDLGFGAISGNTYNPLNFLEVLKSDNSSTFTLNWGADTGIVDEKHPLVYNGEKYSFDALWEVADHGGVVDEGERVKPIKKLYISKKNGVTWSSLRDKELRLNFEFIDIGDTVEFNVESVAVYVYGGLNFSSDDISSGVTMEYNALNKTFTITLADDALTGENGIENSIKTAIKWDTLSPEQKAKYGNDLMSRTNYKNTFVIDVTYSMSINGGQKTYNSIAAGATSSDDIYK